MAFPADDQAALVDLLRRLAAAGGALPTTPRPIWDALAGVVPRFAVELCLTRGDAIWLIHRQDETWNGWHVPGGFVGVDESLGAAARRIARRELELDVEVDAIVGDFAWPDHPCGSVLSLLCDVRAARAPSVGSWFEALPDDMVPHHAELVARFRRARAAGARW